MKNSLGRRLLFANVVFTLGALGCAEVSAERVEHASDGITTTPLVDVDPTTGPCSPLVDRLVASFTAGGELQSASDVRHMLRDTGLVWPNHPSFSDPSAPAMRIATVSLVTGEVTIFDVATEASTAASDDARRIGGDEGHTRTARRIWSARALLGARLGSSEQVSSTRASYQIRDGRSAVARPASMLDATACFDGRQGLLVDQEGVPRTSLTPPAILRMWSGTFRNANFSPPHAPDSWSRPRAPGTRHLLVKFQVRSPDGSMTDSSANSDYTVHEVPPTVCYETGAAAACGRATVPRPSLLRAANDGDDTTDPATLSPRWLHWTGGCVNLHGDLSDLGRDARGTPDFRTFDTLMDEARQDGRPVYVVLSYPGLAQARLVKDPRTTGSSSFGDGLLGRTTPSWYGDL